MKITRFLPIIVLVLGMSACNNPAGQLVGASIDGPMGDVAPLGMKFIRQGSFLMGANEQSVVFAQSDNNIKVSVNAFWMDETEITNNEYRQFVYWVRDSIARSLLIDEQNNEFGRFNDTTQKYVINWAKPIPWIDRQNPNAQLDVTVLDSLFYDNGLGGLNISKLRYNYSWSNTGAAIDREKRFDVAKGVYPEGTMIEVDTFYIDANGLIKRETVKRRLREPKDLLTNAIICIYPDTMVWARDFDYSYNDPLLHGYFSMPSYAEYPVVGVTWEQAHAFCHWRTQLLRTEGKQLILPYRLPSEAEWEFAARGGLKAAMYPWGNKSTRDAKGCFLANFKPYRGSYHNDTGSTTMAVGGFEPNDFGLYDMAGNVAEGTASAYSAIANVSVHDMNPSYSYNARKDDPDILKRKVVKGGSWKDVSYYLQCGVRTYEYQYESRSYIGFRCVRSYIGN